MTQIMRWILFENNQKGGAKLLHELRLMFNLSIKCRPRYRSHTSQGLFPPLFPQEYEGGFCLWKYDNFFYIILHESIVLLEWTPDEMSWSISSFLYLN